MTHQASPEQEGMGRYGQAHSREWLGEHRGGGRRLLKAAASHRRRALPMEDGPVPDVDLSDDECWWSNWQGDFDDYDYDDREHYDPDTWWEKSLAPRDPDPSGTWARAGGAWYRVPAYNFWRGRGPG